MKLINKTSYAQTIDFAYNQFDTENFDFTLVVTEDKTLDDESYTANTVDGIISVIGGDKSGCMYGVLDVISLVQNGKCIENISHKAYIKNRGIKFNIPLDSRTPSYSDASDSAQQNIENMWKFSFWETFIDNMAKNKMNALSLWNLHPFPSMTKVPEYPDVALDDVMVTTLTMRSDLMGQTMSNDYIRSDMATVKKISIDDKISFWQKVMEYADSRCVKIYVMTWNIFVYGTEHTDYGITIDMDNETTIDYFKHSVEAMIKTYPLLAGIGVTAGEQMSQTSADTPWLWNTFGEGINLGLEGTPNRDFLFIHRAHFTNSRAIAESFAKLKCKWDFSFKYSQAHMYANTNPSFGEQFFKEIKDIGVKTWLTVRNDDFYMYRWGDPTFAKEYLQNMPHDVLSGFYMGPDGYTWGVEYITKEPSLQGKQVLQKMWYMLNIWGNLSYNIDLPEEHFEQILAEKFPDTDAEKLYTAWKLSSKIIPTLQCTRWYDLDFQWYPEACVSFSREHLNARFRSIHDFMYLRSAPKSGYLSVKDYCEGNLDGISPVQTTDDITKYSETANDIAKELLKTSSDAELTATLNDIMALAKLGMYYSLKLKSAIALLSWKLHKDEKGKTLAVNLLNEAYRVWCEYAELSTALYYPQLLTRFSESVDVMRYRYNAKLDISLAEHEER